jgi:hypothetical protein
LKKIIQLRLREIPRIDSSGIAIYEDPTVEPVYDDYSLQVIEDQTEYYETISEFCYDSDLEPIDSSDEECELIDDDVIDEDAVQFPFDAMCDDEVPTNVHLVDDVPVPDFKKKLASWAVEFRVKQNAVDSLLSDVLPTLPDYDTLNIPKTCRTLLQTMKKTPLKEVKPGQYYHFGLARRVKYMLDRYGGHLTPEIHDVLKFLINTDGLPVAKASGSQVWPIQCRFFYSLMEDWPAFVLGVFQGNSKPANVNDYMEDFVNEILHLQENGFLYRGKLIKIIIFGFNCDAPANALMKSIKIHTGYESCPKCEVHGKWAGRVVLLQTSSPLRSDENFRNQSHEGHHTGTSILEKLDIDMIRVFAIDYMHCVCLGVMRKLLWVWIRGPLATRIGRQNIELISAALEALVDFIPCDFARKPIPSIYRSSHIKEYFQRKAARGFL